MLYYRNTSLPVKIKDQITVISITGQRIHGKKT